MRPPRSPSRRNTVVEVVVAVAVVVDEAVDVSVDDHLTLNLPFSLNKFKRGTKK